MSLNAYNLKCLSDLGVSIPKLGCVMLDVEPLDIKGAIPPEWAYVSTNPNMRHVSGIQTEGHITLLFGLLHNANTIRPAIDEVLNGWETGDIFTQSISAFPSPMESEPYSCIIAEIQLTPAISDAHSRLSLLPHIDTHPTYRPHLTIGYVHKDRQQDAIDAVRRVLGTRDIFTHAKLETIGLNYGDNPPDQP